jgi:hypothetical protein
VSAASALRDLIAALPKTMAGMLDDLVLEAQAAGREAALREQARIRALSREDHLAAVRTLVTDERVLQLVAEALDQALEERRAHELTKAELDRIRERAAGLRREVEGLRGVIEWASGAHASESFRPREPGEGPYWWRKELAGRTAAVKGADHA